MSDQLPVDEYTSDQAPVLPEIGIRTSLVSRVSAEIDAGTYETPGKLDEAVEELGLDLMMPDPACMN